MNKDKNSALAINPDQLKLTPIQAERLGALSNIDPKPLVGMTIAQITEKYRFAIDPSILFFRKICGKVVKKDPITGVEYPVA